MLRVSAPERIVASPLARRLAREHRVDLSALRRGRRIVRADVEAFIAASRPGSAPDAAVSTDAQAMRRRDVQRFSIAFDAAPVFGMLDEFASALGNASRGDVRARISPQAVICKAWAIALGEGLGPVVGGVTAGLRVRMLDARSDRGVVLSDVHQLRLSEITRALDDGERCLPANQTTDLRTAAVWFVMTAAIDIVAPAETPHGCLAVVSALDRPGSDGGNACCRLSAVFDGDDSSLGRLLGIADLFKRLIEKPWGLVA